MTKERLRRQLHFRPIQPLSGLTIR